MTKICVYAICKNEIKFLRRWLKPLQEADYIVVLDTGSDDGTYEELQKLKEEGMITCVEQKIIDPWRFDSARNESMKLIPSDTDICVVSDCDQIFREGWGDELRELCGKGYDEVYGPIIDYDDDGNEIKRFLSKNVHPNRKEWYWERPVHEGISYHGNSRYTAITSDSFIIEHHPDRTKSRDQYLDILEREYRSYDIVKDPMCAIYYGCELSFHGKDEEALQVFLKAMDDCDFSEHPECGYQIALNIADEYLELPKSVLKNKVQPSVFASTIAELCEVSAHEIDKALHYAYKSLNFGIKTRRAYMAIADLYILLEDNDKVIEYGLCALSIKEQDKSWIETASLFGSDPYTMIALAYSRKRDYENAFRFLLLADNAEKEDEVKMIQIQKLIESTVNNYIYEGKEEENAGY